MVVRGQHVADRDNRFEADVFISCQVKDPGRQLRQIFKVDHILVLGFPVTQYSCVVRQEQQRTAVSSILGWC